MGTSKAGDQRRVHPSGGTSMVRVPDDGSVAPVTDTWSAVTGVTGNLRAGSSAVGVVT
jgi:hypothetical protein